MDITKRLSHFLIKFLIISFVAGTFPGNLAWEVQVGVPAFAVPKMAYALAAVKLLWTFHQDLLPRWPPQSEKLSLISVGPAWRC